MPKHSSSNLSLSKLKAKLQASQAPLPPVREPEPNPAFPIGDADADARYAESIRRKLAELAQKKSNAKGPVLRRYPNKEGGFTENERAVLLRGVIDALRVKRPDVEFSVWAKYGLSRLYFLDDSWLGYGADGRCIYGRTDDSGNSVPDKSTTAYEVRRALGLAKAAKRGTISG
jgi:hypothetical protein